MDPSSHHQGPEWASLPGSLSSVSPSKGRRWWIGKEQDHSPIQPVLDPSAVWSQGSQAQEPILISAKTMLESSSYLIRTARSLAINPKDPPTWSVLAGHSHTVSDSIKSLITSIRLVLPPEIASDLYLNKAGGNNLSGLVFNSNVVDHDHLFLSLFEIR